MVPGPRLVAHEALGAEELPRRTALDEVGREREGRAGEADQGHAVGERLLDEPHRLEDERHRLVHRHGSEPLHVFRAPDRTVDVRPVAPGELEADAEGLEHEQDVGEEDRGIDAEPVHRLERHLGGGLGILAELEEAAAGPDGAVLGHVAPGLAHEPHGGERGRGAPASLEER